MANFDSLSLRNVLSRQNIEIRYLEEGSAVFFRTFWHVQICTHMAHILKICAIWVQIRIYQKMQKNSVDRSIETIFLNFTRKVSSGAKMGQN